jgi:YggT family protein
MIGNALIFLIQTLCEFFAGVLLLRFWMQFSRVAGRNPLSAFVQALTNFAVLPARRVIPGLWGLDLATLLLAWITLVVEMLLMLLVKGAVPDSGAAAGMVLLMAVVMLLRLAIYLAIGAILLQVILSWVNPDSPMTPLVSTLTRPLLRPISRVVPPIGMVDLSPLVALLLLQLVLMVPLAYLEQWVGRAFL